MKCTIWLHQGNFFHLRFPKMVALFSKISEFPSHEFLLFLYIFFQGMTWSCLIQDQFSIDFLITNPFQVWTWYANKVWIHIIECLLILSIIFPYKLPSWTHPQRQKEIYSKRKRVEISMASNKINFVLMFTLVAIIISTLTLPLINARELSTAKQSQYSGSSIYKH